MSWKGMKKLLDRESLLKQLNLEERTPGSDFLTGLGLFSVGVLVGAGLGLLFAPQRGQEIRGMLSDRLRNRAAGKSAESPMGAEAGVPPATSSFGH